MKRIKVKEKSEEERQKETRNKILNDDKGQWEEIQRRSILVMKAGGAERGYGCQGGSGRVTVGRRRGWGGLLTTWLIFESPFNHRSDGAFNFNPPFFILLT